MDTNNDFRILQNTLNNYNIFIYIVTNKSDKLCIKMTSNIPSISQTHNLINEKH